MPVSLDLLDGTSNDAVAVLRYLDEELVPQAVRIMNEDTLPLAVVLFPDDALPTNQRNLTDVRTRIGILLEYEFAKAVTEALPAAIKDQGIALTYVIANQFPDLAFRSGDGKVGIRFEMKAIQTIAEEKSANFSTLTKDIRRDTDFVVVLLWEWREHESQSKKFPHIYSHFVMDAYQLAQIRDCNWLNNPPAALQSARQGFDLTFAVNAKGDSYNKEEGNYGKLMRIFDAKHEAFLPVSVRQGTTLARYYLFSQEAARLGLKHIGQEIAAQASVQNQGVHAQIAETLPVCFLAQRGDRRLIILGNQRMPTKQQAMPAMQEHEASHALLLNEKFRWTVRDGSWGIVGRGRKPAEAMSWMREQWEQV